MQLVYAIKRSIAPELRRILQLVFKFGVWRVVGLRQKVGDEYPAIRELNGSLYTTPSGVILKGARWFPIRRNTLKTCGNLPFLSAFPNRTA
jgi:hypothetical protein